MSVITTMWYPSSGYHETEHSILFTSNIKLYASVKVRLKSMYDKHVLQPAWTCTLSCRCESEMSTPEVWNDFNLLWWAANHSTFRWDEEWAANDKVWRYWAANHSTVLMRWNSINDGTFNHNFISTLASCMPVSTIALLLCSWLLCSSLLL